MHGRSADNRSVNYIDAHTHVWTDDTASYPLGIGWQATDMQPRRFTPEDFLRHARPCGVTRANLIQMSYYYPREPGRISEIGYSFDNRYMLDAIRQYPGVFVGTAVVDPLGADPAGAMTELARQRVRAFRIAPRLTRQPPASWLAPDGCAKMFAAGAQHNLAMSCLI